MGVVVGADLGGDGEAGRDGQADVGHLGEVGALAAEEVLHLAVAVGLAAAEEVDVLVLMDWCSRELVARASGAVYGCAREAANVAAVGGSLGKISGGEVYCREEVKEG